MVEDDRADFDNLVWDKNDEAWEKSQRRLRYTQTCLLAASLAEQKFGQPAKFVSPVHIGGYNVLYKIHLEETSLDVMVRLPCPELCQFPHEKVVAEAAIMKYVANRTNIPIPQLFHHGFDSELGPFLIIQHITNSLTLSHELRLPNKDPDAAYCLDPGISEEVHMKYDVKVATYLLQLSKLNFPRIGSLAEVEGSGVDEPTYAIKGRPLSMNMSNMIQLANIPRAILPPQDKTYDSADDWYIALAEMHWAQLVFQHNDLVSSEDDCRNRYVARYLFHKLAKQGRLSTFGFADDSWSSQASNYSSTLLAAPPGSDSFRLWCDDFRAGNILIDDSKDIISVIDWEFSYFGPSQFILDPPWWLLFEVPEMWEFGIEDWAKVYELRLKTWLAAMKQVEGRMESGSVPFCLSTHMKESWETGRFWLNYAAKKSWAFDNIFWKFLDERFFGARSETAKDDLWKTRIHLLSKKERDAMEVFVERKMEESKERIVVDWEPQDAQIRLAEVMSSLYEPS